LALAAEAVRKQGYTVLSARGRGLPAVLGARRARFPTTLFSIELISLLEAGMNLVESLQALARREQRGDPLAVLSGLLCAIERGESFSRAVSAFPEHFSPLYVATIKSSERTGNVRESLLRYVTYQEEQERVRKKVVSAAIYPTILLIVGMLVLLFL